MQSTWLFSILAYAPISTLGKYTTNSGMRRQTRVRGPLKSSVLVADDNADLRELVSHQLQKLGVEVMVAGNGQEAMELALAQNPHLVLMDMEMPILSGLDAVTKLRERGFEGVIVAFTAHDDGIRTQNALACGCNAVLKKPLSPSKFRTRMTEFLSLRGSPVV